MDITKKELLEKISELGETQEKSDDDLDLKMDEWWNSLSKEDQLNAFYSVIKRVTKAEAEGATYRYVLYDVFGFPPSSYQIGMSCGFLSLHNMIDRQYPVEPYNYYA